MNNKGIIQLDTDTIRTKIHFIRGQQVMLDNDLSEIYEVETRVFNQAVKRNSERFPKSFCFQLTEEEFNNLRSQIVILKRAGRGQHRKYLPFAFTEQGVSMLAAVLHSKTAIQISIKIMDTFVEMRRFLYNNAQVFSRLDLVERKQIIFESETERNFEKVFQALEKSQESPKQGIFYDGQVYDAYIFVCSLIRKAKKSLVLIDNYVDESVLSLLSKRADCGIATIIYTKSVSKQLALDLTKHNEQYSPITIKIFENSHDRFLIIDEKEIYHIGASLKDLGKKWFAFSKLELGAVGISPRMAGIPPDDFVLETAIRALESQEEFQATLRNVRNIIAAGKHPLDKEPAGWRTFNIFLSSVILRKCTRCWGMSFCMMSFFFG